MGKEDKPFEPRVAAAAIYRELVRIREALERLSPPPAPSVDLDGPRGDPKVRMIPRDWKGETHFKGGPMSAAPPELLELLAQTLEYFASKNTDPKKAGYDRLDAARARGWAQRKRDGWKPSEPTPASSPAAAPAYEAPSYEVPPTSTPAIADDDFPFGANAPGYEPPATSPDEDDDLPTFE